MALFTPKQRMALAAFAEAAEGDAKRFRKGVDIAIAEAKNKGREATESDILTAIRKLTAAAKNIITKSTS